MFRMNYKTSLMIPKHKFKITIYKGLYEHQKPNGSNNHVAAV